MSKSDQIVAAVILGVLGIVGSVIGVVFANHDSGTQHPVAAHGSVTSPSRTYNPIPSGDTASQPSEPSPANVGASSIAFQGPIAFDGNNGIDFDVNPPTSQGYNDTVGLDTAVPSILAEDGSHVAQWPKAGIPTQAACHEWVLTHPLGSVAVQVGTQLCIYSIGQHTAYLRVTGIDMSTGTIDATVIVWSS